MKMLALLGHHGQHGHHALLRVEAGLMIEQENVFWKQTLRIKKTLNYFVLAMMMRKKNAMKINAPVRNKFNETLCIKILWPHKRLTPTKTFCFRAWTMV